MILVILLVLYLGAVLAARRRTLRPIDPLALQLASDAMRAAGMSAPRAIQRAGLFRWWWYDETWAPHGPYWTEAGARRDLAAYARYLAGS